VHGSKFVDLGGAAATPIQNGSLQVDLPAYGHQIVAVSK
jgi:hypothetical protein